MLCTTIQQSLLRLGATILLLFGVLIGSATQVTAQESNLTLTTTETLTIEYHGDNQNDADDDDDYGIAISRFNVSGTQDDITVSFRVDSTYFAFPDRDPIPSFVDDIARLERLSAQYRLGSWTLDAGDYYTSLGRGLALSIRKLSEVGLDISVRGGRLNYDSQEHQLSLFAGVLNTSNLDSVSQRFVEDTDDILGGASYELRALDSVDLGIFGLYFEPEERLLESRDLTASTGLYAEMYQMTDWLSLYLEGDFQHRELAGEIDRGYAGYATADLAFGDFVVLVEGLAMDEYELRGSRNSALDNRFTYNQAPTLERIDQEVALTRDVLGGRVRAEYYFFDLDLLVFGNGMFRLNNPDTAGEVRQIHGYGGLEIYLDQGLGHLNLGGGYRNETQQGEEIKSMIHGEVDLLHPVGQGLSLHLTSTNELRTLQDTDYQRGSTMAGIDFTGTGGFTFEFGYDTLDQRDEAQNLFYAGILFLELSDELRLDVTAGTQRGGIKCINGICREFPEFAGGRAVLVGRF